MSEQKDGGPAFPSEKRDGDGRPYRYESGMTLRQYAAIKLRVPDSGTDWLDEMILKSLRDEMAAKAMQGMLASPTSRHITHFFAVIPAEAYTMADAMLRKRAKP